ncbi:MAG: hypothetical protein FIA97_19660 [Methylococcaceae bacterium]|nr:hypothetical protein [Methylococcaceae bacterium]
MQPSTAVLIAECDPLFCTALRNHLLSAGVDSVDLAMSVRRALWKLRQQDYGTVLIGFCPPFRRAERLAAVVRRRQPQARAWCLISAADLRDAPSGPYQFLIRERSLCELTDLIGRR